MLNKIRNQFIIRRHNIFLINNLNNLNTLHLNTNIKLTEVTVDNIGHIKDFRSEKHIATFNKLLEGGQYGIYAWMDSKVVGHAWAKVCTKHHERVNGYIDIFKDDALIHYCNVSENNRGKNIYPTMLNALCQKLFLETEVQRVLIDPEFDNKASLRGIIKAGFKPLGKGTYIQLAGRLIYKHENFNSGIQDVTADFIK